MRLAELQDTMMQSLLAPQLSTSTDPYKRMQQAIDTRDNIDGIGIYHHAYSARLAGVLANDHEKLQIFLAADFDQLAKQYIAQYPSKVASLRHFGSQFPDFLATSEHPDASLASQLCLFERTLLDAYDARDDTPLGWQQLSAINPEQWPELIFSLHPSLHLFEDSTASVNVWQAIQSGQFRPDKLTETAPTTWVIWRDLERICQFRTITPAQQICLKKMQAGYPFADIAEELVNYIPPEELGAALFEWIGQWCEAGIISEQTLTE